MRKLSLCVLLGLVLSICLVPQSSGILWGSFPPLPYWHGGVGNHTVWTDTNYINVNVTGNATVNKQIKSNIAIGTSPFIIVSTTKNTNLNSDLLDNKHVGISGNSIPLLDGTNTWSGGQTFSATADLTFSAGTDIILATTTGTKIGTGTTQKLGFWGVTPVVQQAQSIDMKDMLVSYGFYSVTATSTPLDLDNGAFVCGKLTAADISGKTGNFADDITTTSATPSVFLIDSDDSHDDYSINAQTSIFTIRNDVDSVNAISVAGTGGITLNAGADNAYTLTDAENFVFGSITGNMIGSSNSQKIGFFGTSPVVQPLATTDLGTILSNLGLRASGTAYPITTSGAVSLTGTFSCRNLSMTPAGSGLSIKEGTNAKMGIATLVAGTVTVNTNRVTASSRIFLTVQSLGTVAIPTAIAVTATVAGTSFTITSASVTDTSVVAWVLIEPS